MTPPPPGVDPLTATCPAPTRENEHVLLGHGSGGQLSAELLQRVLLPALGDASPSGPLEDAAVVRIASPGVRDLVISTDAFVVSPLFFPGGDIGSLAVHGTINDVAMRGAEPLALSIALIVEEGLPIADLERVAASAGKAATDAGVPIVTGDTKVVGRGAADGLYIATTGVGRRLRGARISAGQVRAGDVLLLSGPIGLHGTTVLSVREGLGFEADIASDTRPLHRLVRAMVEAAGRDVHAVRDPTRGGVASTLNELADASHVGVILDEAALPIPDAVAAACELLGLDPLHVANEGCLLAFVSPDAADAVLAAMRSLPEAADAVRIGEAVAAHPGRVSVRTLMGAHRVLDMLVGEQLPRIC